MPSVTRYPCSANLPASRSAWLNASILVITWSAVNTAMTACGSCRAMLAAAQPTAADVLRPTGSPRICCTGTEGTCSCTSSAITRPVTTHVRSGAYSVSIRARDSWIKLLPLGSGKNCLGKLVVLSGHSRVPLPPARITALK